MGIGTDLQELINIKCTNVNELAKKINVSPQTLYSIIKRDNMKVDFDVLLKICDELKVDVEYFYQKITNVSSVVPDKKMISELIANFNLLNENGQKVLLLQSLMMKEQAEYKKHINVTSC